MISFVFPHLFYAKNFEDYIMPGDVPGQPVFVTFRREGTDDFCDGSRDIFALCWRQIVSK
jgi:hypothetical protein